MSIPDRVRKVLWGKAGNRCSRCRKVLVQPGETSGHAVVGEECHIIAPRRGGPRGHFETLGDLDGYANLILLCPSDHTLIDQLHEDWPPSRLHALKAEHGAWVDRRLSPPEPEPKSGVHRERPGALVDITNAAELVGIAMGVEESSLNHEELTDEADVDLVAGFLQNVFDYGRCGRTSSRDSGCERSTNSAGCSATYMTTAGAYSGRRAGGRCGVTTAARRPGAPPTSASFGRKGKRL
jgi:hypothetical protein